MRTDKQMHIANVEVSTIQSNNAKRIKLFLTQQASDDQGVCINGGNESITLFTNNSFYKNSLEALKTSLGITNFVDGTMKVNVDLVVNISEEVVKVPDYAVNGKVRNTITVRGLRGEDLEYKANQIHHNNLTSGKWLPYEQTPIGKSKKTIN